MPLQKLIFTRGLNSDSTPEMVGEGEARFRLNVRVMSAEDDNVGGIEPVLGNTLIEYTLPDGENKVIGAEEDKKRGMVYYFVWNEFHIDSILQYSIAANEVTKVLEMDLNFDKDHLITGINIVELNATAHLLYWTDNYVNPADVNDYNEPRKINIEKAIAFSDGDFVNGYPSPFNPLWYFRIKQPPLFPPTYTWSGISSALPVVKFTATSNTTQSIPYNITTPTTLSFNIDGGSPGDGYDTSTYEWTADVTGVNDIQTSNTITYVLNTHFYIYIWINGVQSSGREYIYADPPSANPITVITQFDNVLLNAGDKIKVVIYNGLSASTISVDAGYYTISTVPASTSVSVNHLFKKLFQFKIKYVFDDYEESAWSPISKFVMPVTTNGGASGEDITYQDNIITIPLPTGNAIVKRIKIAARNVDQTDFSLIADLDKKELGIADDTTYDYIFTDFGGALPIEINDSIKLFDSVPLRSKSQEFIGGNRIVDGLITEGFDPIDIDMRLTLAFELIDVNVNSWFPKYSYLKSGGKYEFGIVYYDLPGNRSGLTNSTPGPFDTQNQFGKFGNQLYVPFLTDINYNAPHGTPNLDMSYVPIAFALIYSQPPAWATHFQIVRSKNQSMSKYIQFTAERFSYHSPDFTILGSTSVRMFIGNITGAFKDENPASHLVYTFATGDRLRFIAPVDYASYNPAAPAFNTEIQKFYPYIDVPIASAGTDSDGVYYVEFVNTPNIPLVSSTGASLLAGCLFEIYTPNNVIDEKSEIIYEIGECYEVKTDIHGNRVHGGQLDELISTFNVSILVGSTLTISLPVGHGILAGEAVKVVGDNGFSSYGTVTTALPSQLDIDVTGFTVIGSVSGPGLVTRAAKVRMNGGDTFRRLRNMVYQPGGVPGTSDITYRLQHYIEDAQVSDVFVSPADDIGRPNRIDDTFRRITRPTTVFWSQQLVPETQINGLSSVFDISFQTYEQKYGGIYKLHSEDNALIAFMELKVLNIPVNQAIINQLNPDKLIGTSDDVLSPQPIPYMGEFGIGKNAESFAVYGYSKYFIDLRRGAVLRLSKDGITNLSELYNFNNYITDKFKILLGGEDQSIPKIYGVYDTKFKEYIVSIETYTYASSNPVGPVLVPGVTFAFNEKYNQFSTFYSYLPDYMAMANQGIITFKNGACYLHNNNVTYNNFYGIQYTSQMWLVVNAFPSNQKVFQAVALEGNAAWNVTLQTPSGQTTGLLTNNFQFKEGFQYANFLFDDNTPNVTNPRFEGNPMRGQTAILKLTFPGTGYTKLFAVNVMFIPSNRSNG